MEPDKHNYESLRFRHAIGLAAPHTWPASILPVLLGAVLCFVLTKRWDPLLSVCLLAISVLMQSAVNTLNDYSDYLKENDTLDNSDDPEDAILVYYNVNPKSACLLGFAFLAAAALIGVWVTLKAGYIPLVLGAVGGAVLLLYCFGKLPISYIPLGEFVSGFVMGALITLATYTALSGQFYLMAMLYSIPLIIGIALLMFTNNLCDIEKDIPAGKKTMTVLIGRKKSRALYAVIIGLWMASIACLVLVFFQKGAWLLPPLLAFSIFLTVKQMKLSLARDTRPQSMMGILRLKLVLQLGYIAAIMLHGILK